MHPCEHLILERFQAKSQYTESIVSLKAQTARCHVVLPGLDLDGASQQDAAAASNAPEDLQPQSPQQRPPNYLSAMLTYMAQVLAFTTLRATCLIWLH